MKEGLEENGAFLDIALSEIGQSYARLRFIHPQADASMVESIRKYGQISPVLLGRGKGGQYELVDGFKRFRALRQLGFNSVMAKVLDGGTRALKAAIICLNWKKGSISDLEEAMVVHSLYHDDGLTQVEIATLLGRHKSWVCRRFSLIERLCDEALNHIRLGLITTSIGRELARLPRGNQQAALSTILKYRLCSRESARLVSILLQRPRWNWQSILRFPEEILSARTPDRPRNSDWSRIAPPLHRTLIDIERRFHSISKQYGPDVFAQFTTQDWRHISFRVQKIDAAFNHFKNIIHESISDPGQGCQVKR
jgi:ParB/RepB/Spo0J family partition protein